MRAVNDPDVLFTRVNSAGTLTPMTTTSTPRRVIGYLRVSTDRQARSGLGLDAQARAIGAAATARGWEMVGTYTDDGCSAGTLRRPALAEALAALDRGEADALVVAKLDRLSRSVGDFTALTERARRRGWALVCLDIDVDTASPSGELVATITASVAQWERRIISARTIDALAAKRAQGARLGRPVALPTEVRDRIVAERAAGRPFAAIAADLVADGVPTARGGRWAPATVRAVCVSVDHDRAALAAAELAGLVAA
jgi:DNA invertase Pin-like site-specific DNA recombinase